MPLKIIFFITVMGAGFFFFVHEKEGPEKAETWQTYQYEEKSDKSQKIISSHKTTQEELKIIRQDNDQSKKREPSQAPSMPSGPSEEQVYSIQGRSISGLPHNQLEHIDFGKIEMTNEFDPDWEEKLGRQQLRFQKSSTKVAIKKNSSQVYLKKAKNKVFGSFVEIVTLNYISSDGVSSYNAMVDSATGKIIQTWNKSIQENLRKRPLSLELEQ
jgi:hypothetical protein